MLADARKNKTLDTVQRKALAFAMLPSAGGLLRSTVNGPPSPVESIKTRSRNKFGMTLNRRPQTGALNKSISGQAHWDDK